MPKSCGQLERLVHDHIWATTYITYSKILKLLCLLWVFLVHVYLGSWPHCYYAFHIQKCELKRYVILHSHKQWTIWYQNSAHIKLKHSWRNIHAMTWFLSTWKDSGTFSKFFSSLSRWNKSTNFFIAHAPYKHKQ